VAIHGIHENELRAALSALEEADIIYRIGLSPFIRFAFKHVLLRDAIYSSLLKSKRREIHADIAAVLAKHFRELVETRPEVLAYHHSEAGEYQLAISAWHEAGQRALAHSANLDAIAHFRKALETLSAMPDTHAGAEPAGNQYSAGAGYPAHRGPRLCVGRDI